MSSLWITITSAIITTFISVPISLYIGYQGHIWVSRRERNTRLFIPKKEAYQPFIDLLSETLQNQVESRDLNEKQREKFEKEHQEKLKKELFIFRKNILIWGGTDVINSFLAWIQTANSNDTEKQFLCINSLLQEIRKDLGHDHYDGEIFAIFK